MSERWTARRKEDVLMTVAAGKTTADTICAEHGISPEEFDAWTVAYRERGVEGLRAINRRHPSE